MRDYFFDGIKRMDWGFGNPNITAGLIAILMMAIWILFRIHRWGFWPALVGFGTLGVCLIQTISRGGVVAAIAGGLILVLLAKRPWPRSRWIPILVCVLGLVIYAFAHGVAARYAQGIVVEDGSVSNRWLIYKMTPAMMVDAPEGWGLKKAGEVFHNFYQPEGRFERYGSLVSSHLTWMVEVNWLARFGYVLGWFLILFLCLPSKKRWWYSIALATWVAFGTATTFTTMANRWILWIGPGLVLLAVLIERIRCGDWPERKKFITPVIASAVCLGLFAIVGTLIKPSQPKITKRAGWVELGNANGQGSNWIMEPDSAVLGKAYGQKIRGIVSQKNATSRSVVVEWGDGVLAPTKKDQLIFSGKGIEELGGDLLVSAQKAESWMLLNPEVPTGELLKSIEEGVCPLIHVVWGEFNPGRGRIIWEALSKKYEGISLEKVTAAGKFLPDWTNRLTQ